VPKGRELKIACTQSAGLSGALIFLSIVQGLAKRLSYPSNWFTHPSLDMNKNLIAVYWILDQYMMTHKQRFLAALDMKTPDRIPLFYQHLGGAKWVLASCQKRIRDGYRDPDVFAEISMAAQKVFGFDNAMAGWGDILIEAQAHGTMLKFPDRDYYPRPVKYPVKSITDIDRILPIDPMEDALWSVQLKGAAIMNERIGKEIAVVGCIDSPFVIASEVMGLEYLMISMLSDPAASEKLVATVTESSLMYMDRIAKDIGLESVFIENGMAGGDLVRLDTCQRFDLKYMRPLIDRCRELGLRTIVHNCSAKPYLEAEADMGPSCLHFNNKMVNLEAIRNLRERTCLMAGIDHMELLFTGTPAEIESEVRRVIDLFGKGPGFILAPGCEMPFKTPIENIAAFKRTVERYGTC
jgi:uroporphyrinogen decarboxylase